MPTREDLGECLGTWKGDEWPDRYEARNLGHCAPAHNAPYRRPYRPMEHEVIRVALLRSVIYSPARYKESARVAVQMWLDFMLVYRATRGDSNAKGNESGQYVSSDAQIGSQCRASRPDSPETNRPKPPDGPTTQAASQIQQKEVKPAPFAWWNQPTVQRDPHLK